MYWVLQDKYRQNKVFQPSSHKYKLKEQHHLKNKKLKDSSISGGGRSSSEIYLLILKL
jgi:hypothetical protein